MGIDKADVRFVIHHSLPKSLEGYYQETGRAGRDGKRSDCYLYYLYADCKVLKKMIEEGEGSREQKQRQSDMLRNVIQFCENKSDCRRAQVLSYFSEPFKSEDCHNTCDNCNSGAIFEEKDLTDYAAAAIRMVASIEKRNEGLEWNDKYKVTLHQYVDAARGAKNAKLKNTGIEEYGFGEDLERGDVERLFNHLLEAQALRERSKTNKAGFATNYVHVSIPLIIRESTKKLQLGPRSKGYENGRTKFMMQVRTTARKPRVKAVTAKPTKKKRTEIPSTNVSSPAHPPAKRNLRQYTYEEQDDDEYFDQPPTPRRGKKRTGYKDDDFVVPDDSVPDLFAPRGSKSARAPASKPHSKPITADDRIADLSDVQKDFLYDFMQGAKGMGKKIQVDKGYRNVPFSDTIIREMALDLPRTIEEMLAIPNINADMVQLYGRKFLPLVANTRTRFMDSGGIPVPKNQYSTRRHPAPIIEEDDFDDDYASDDDDEQTPLDPNHQIIDLTADNDGGNAEESQSQQAPGNSPRMDESEDEDDGAGTRSHYFVPTLDPRVEEFQKQYSQTQVARPAARPAAPAPSASKAGSRMLPWKGRKSSGPRRRSSAGPSKAPYGGVSKRSKTPSVRKSNTAGGTRRTPSTLR